MISNEKFMEMMEEDYPNTDWDNLPPLDSYPDVYELQGLQLMNHFDIFIEGVEKRVARIHTTSPQKAIESYKERYPEAKTLDSKNIIAKIAAMNGKEFTASLIHFCVSEIETFEKANEVMEKYKSFEGVKIDSLKIVTRKPIEAINKDLYKQFREEILKGKKLFPMYLL